MKKFKYIIEFTYPRGLSDEKKQETANAPPNGIPTGKRVYGNSNPKGISMR